MKWISLIKKQPTYAGIYAVVVLRRSFATSNFKTRVGLVTPETRTVTWALWAYKEILEGANDSFVTYKKFWGFFDDERNPIGDVLFWCPLPMVPLDKSPKEKSSEEKK